MMTENLQGVFFLGGEGEDEKGTGFCQCNERIHQAEQACRRQRRDAKGEKKS